VPTEKCKLGAAALLLFSLAVPPTSWAAPPLKQLGPGLYAYISENDASANSTILIGSKGILVVDTGFDATEADKLLHAIRDISALPIQYVVNTHYHRDHQGGNCVLGSSAARVSTAWTRQRTLAVMQSSPVSPPLFCPAQVTFQEKVTIHLEPYTAEIYFPGKAHTSGDALVYFPAQHAISMGDLFLNRSCPAIDQGSVANWVRALDRVLAMPVEAVVPGHFELGTKADLRRFRDYLFDLYEQVRIIYAKGGTLEEARRNIHMEKYSNFRQYPKFEATFADNAEAIFHELQQN
jgi:glyoxylase-like metal-dependent hydrolase (beta-lactamase superfamily II)